MMTYDQGGWVESHEEYLRRHRERHQHIRDFFKPEDQHMAKQQTKVAIHINDRNYTRGCDVWAGSYVREREGSRWMLTFTYDGKMKGVTIDAGGVYDILPDFHYEVASSATIDLKP